MIPGTGLSLTNRHRMRINMLFFLACLFAASHFFVSPSLSPTEIFLRFGFGFCVHAEPFLCLLSICVFGSRWLILFSIWRYVFACFTRQTSFGWTIFILNRDMLRWIERWNSKHHTWCVCNVPDALPSQKEHRFAKRRP